MKRINQLFLAIAASSAVSAMAADDFTTGVFLLNEAQYGTPATICHLGNDGAWDNRVFAGANEGVTLGNTGAFAAIYGDDIYIVSKQANGTGSILTKADATSFVMKASTNEIGFSGSQGRAFVAVDLAKGYLGTTKGVAIINLADLSLLGTIEGILNDSGKEVECGNMIRVNDRVFITTKSSFIYVVDPSTDTIIETLNMAEITGNEKAKAASIVVDNEGALWASVAGNTSGGTLPYLVKITQSATDASKLETAVIDIPEDIFAPANSWYTWTTDAFCSAANAPALYWNGGASSFNSNKLIFKYDIEKGEFSKFHEFESDQFLYGSAMRVSIVDNDIYLVYNVGKNAYTNASVLARFTPGGDVVATYPMTEEFWFPTLVFFPDVKAPVEGSLQMPIAVDGDQTETVISLDNIATDPDSRDALIIKSLSENRTPELCEMEVANGQLVVKPVSGANGTAVAAINVNSNGRTKVMDVTLNIATQSGVENVSAADNFFAAYRSEPNAVRLLGQGEAAVFSISGAKLATVDVAGEATVTVPATPVIVRFNGKATKL